MVLLDNVRDIMFNSELYEKTYVRNLMINPPAHIYFTDSMEEVMQKLNESNAWNLPVIDNGKYIGFVSKSQMFSVYRKQLMSITED